MSTNNGLNRSPYRLMEWAESVLGPSKCHSIAFTNKPTIRLFGWYGWDGIIWINLPLCKSDKQIRKVVLHEWTHAQQSYRWYKYYQRKLGYEGNPYEIQAINNEGLVNKKRYGRAGSR